AVQAAARVAVVGYISHARLAAANAAAARRQRRLSVDMEQAVAHLQAELGSSVHELEERLQAQTGQLECSASDIDALSGLATLHGEQERCDAAVLVYFNVLKYHPQNVEGLVNLGNALARVDRHDEAEACYYGALRVGKTSPHRARIYYNLARSHAYAGRRGEAVHMLICAGHVNGEYAMRACLDDAFEDARVSPEFTKVLEFGERPLYKHIYGFVDRGQVDELRETFRQNPYLVTVVRTRPVFARFAEFLPRA
ncbi:MAG: tetratricopeptide repeat protein, partial [Candidatus Poribacteria bacterium]